MRAIDQINAEYRDVCTRLGDVEGKLDALTREKTSLLARVRVLNLEMAHRVQFDRDVESATVGSETS